MITADERRRLDLLAELTKGGSPDGTSERVDKTMSGDRLSQLVKIRDKVISMEDDWPDFNAWLSSIELNNRFEIWVLGELLVRGVTFNLDTRLALENGFVLGYIYNEERKRQQ